MSSVRRRDLGIFWFLSALWSGNWLWIKVGLAGLPPFRFAGLRMALACLLLAPFVLKPPRPSVAAPVLLVASAVFERGAPSRWTPGSIFALGYLAVSRESSS